MPQIEDAIIEIKSNKIMITRGEASLSILMDSQFWKNEENRKVMFQLYPELKKLVEIQ